MSDKKDTDTDAVLGWLIILFVLLPGFCIISTLVACVCRMIWRYFGQ